LSSFFGAAFAGAAFAAVNPTSTNTELTYQVINICKEIRFPRRLGMPKRMLEKSLLDDARCGYFFLQQDFFAGFSSFFGAALAGASLAVDPTSPLRYGEAG